MPAVAFAGGGQDVCEGLSSGKVDTVGDPQGVLVEAPEGLVITGYCVKAGSDRSGAGVVYVDLLEGVPELVVAHPSGKAVSHYSLRFGSVGTPVPPVGTPATPAPTPPVVVEPTVPPSPGPSPEPTVPPVAPSPVPTPPVVVPEPTVPPVVVAPVPTPPVVVVPEPTVPPVVVLLPTPPAVTPEPTVPPLIAEPPVPPVTVPPVAPTVPPVVPVVDPPSDGEEWEPGDEESPVPAPAPVLPSPAVPLDGGPDGPVVQGFSETADELPYTGSRSLAVAAAGFALMVAGLALVVLAYRRGDGDAL